MKFIHNKYLVDLLLVFEANQIIANCSQAKPESNDVRGSRFVNYGDLAISSFQLSDYIIGNGEKYSEEEIVNSFSLNEIVSKICKKIDVYLSNQK